MVADQPGARWIEPWLPLMASPVLELGCGDGRDTGVLVAQGLEVIASDLQPRGRVPGSTLVRLDHSRALSFPSGTFATVLASLSLHYFDWATTQAIVANIEACLALEGVLVARFNSTRDTNHGADAPDVIEPNFRNVDGQRKRFFDEGSLRELFRGWRIEHLEEKAIERAGKTKILWELVARRRASDADEGMNADA